MRRYISDEQAARIRGIAYVPGPEVKALRRVLNPNQYTPRVALREAAKRRANPLKCMWERTKVRAKRNGIKFDLALEDMPAMPKMCPVLGIKIYMPEYKQRATGGCNHSPSLDRIKPWLGYVKGNVRIISNRANLIKGNWSPRELRLVLNDIISLGL